MKRARIRWHVRSEVLRRFIEAREAEGWTFTATRDGAGHVAIEVTDANGVTVDWRIASSASDYRAPLNAIRSLKRQLRERGAA